MSASEHRPFPPWSSLIHNQIMKPKQPRGGVRAYLGRWTWACLQVVGMRACGCRREGLIACELSDSGGGILSPQNLTVRTGSASSTREHGNHHAPPPPIPTRKGERTTRRTRVGSTFASIPTPIEAVVAPPLRFWQGMMHQGGGGRAKEAIPGTPRPRGQPATPPHGGQRPREAGLCPRTGPGMHKGWPHGQEKSQWLSCLNGAPSSRARGKQREEQL